MEDEDKSYPAKAGCLKKSLINLDMYGQRFDFLLPDKEKQFKSVPGVIISILGLILILCYGVFKYSIYSNGSDYSIVTEVVEHHFSDDYEFSAREGFRVAAAIVAGDTEDQSTEDPSIGSVKFFIKRWKNDLSSLEFIELKSRICTPADFAFDEEFPGKSFFPIHESSMSLKPLLPVLSCIEGPYSIYGDYNTGNASNLMITFTRCNPAERQCQDEKAIDEWLEYKYLIVAENRQKGSGKGEFD